MVESNVHFFDAKVGHNDPETSGVRSENNAFSSGGSGGGVVDTETKNYLDAKVDAVRSQNDARFAEVLAKVDGVSSKIDAIPKTITFWEAAGIAASAVIVGITVLGIFSAQFSAGVNSLGILDKAAEVQKSRDDAQDQKLDRILDKLIVITPKP